MEAITLDPMETQALQSKAHLKTLERRAWVLPMERGDYLAVLMGFAFCCSRCILGALFEMNPLSQRGEDFVLARKSFIFH